MIPHALATVHRINNHTGAPERERECVCYNKNCTLSSSVPWQSDCYCYSWTNIRSGFQHSMGYSTNRKETKRNEKEREDGRKRSNVRNQVPFFFTLPSLSCCPLEFYGQSICVPVTQVGHDDPLFQRAEHTAVSFPSGVSPRTCFRPLWNGIT